MKRLIWLGMMALSPFLLGMYCSLNPFGQDESENITPSIRFVEEVVSEFLIVTPFATPTPTPTLTPTLTATPTLSPTLIAGGGTGSGSEGNGSNGNGASSGEGTPPLTDPTPIALTSPTALAATPTAVNATPPVVLATPTPPAGAPSPTLVGPVPTSIPSPSLPPAAPSPTSLPSTSEPPPYSTPLPPPTAPPPTAPPPTLPPSPTLPPPPPPPPVIQVAFSALTFQVNENVGNAAITVILNASSNQTVTVDYATRNGSAFGGVDYIPTGGTLTFPPGQTTQTFTVVIINDNVDDPDLETVALSLSNPGNAQLGLSNATLEIGDDDPEPTIKFDSLLYLTDENMPPTLGISLSHPSGKFVSVTYGPNGTGSATPGLDYDPAAFGVLGFGPDPTGVGPTSVSFTWSGVIDDLIDEPPPHETVILQLLNPNNLILDPVFTTTLQIVDDDP